MHFVAESRGPEPVLSDQPLDPVSAGSVAAFRGATDRLERRALGCRETTKACGSGITHSRIVSSRRKRSCGRRAHTCNSRFSSWVPSRFAPACRRAGAWGRAAPLGVLQAYAGSCKRRLVSMLRNPSSCRIKPTLPVAGHRQQRRREPARAQWRGQSGLQDRPRVPDRLFNLQVRCGSASNCGPGAEECGNVHLIDSSGFSAPGAGQSGRGHP